MAQPPSRERFVQSVVLDANGFGSVSITARGDFLLLQTRWSVPSPTPAAAATDAQSTATNSLNGDDFEGTYSGNNDSSNTAHLMLAGDVLTCEWTGGQPGRTATLTIRGFQYRSGEGIQAVGGAGGPPAGAGPGNPILGGQTLIRNAIQSADYVAGVSGWAIFRNGSAEFNDVTVRGTLIVHSPSGAEIEIVADSSSAFINLTPPDVVGHTLDFATLTTVSNPTFTELFIAGPTWDPSLPGSSFPTIEMISTTGESEIDVHADIIDFNSAGTVKISGGPAVQINSPLVTVTNILQNSGDGQTYFRGQRGTTNVAVLAGQANVNGVQALTGFTSTPLVFANVTNAPAGWHAQGIAPSSTQFSINLNSPVAAGANFTGIVQWIALVPTG
jgi:hypothetical protein